MFKYLFILFVFCYEIRGYTSVQSDTTQNLTLLLNSDKHNCTTVAEELQKKPAITMNGHNNYHVGQQIFYVYGEQQMKRLLSNSNKIGQNLESDYLVTPSMGAHKLHSRKVPWNKARQICTQEGGHLAVINSLSEEKILIRMMQERDVNLIWLGLHDLYEEGDWVTVMDESLGSTGYSRWTSIYKNQPDNFKGSQNCATLLTEGGMDDTSCSHNISFICEISL